MAVTKALIKTIPHVTSNRVEQWEMEIKYENNSEGDATYYTSTFSHTAVADDGDFSKAAKGTFSNANLVALCPVAHWDVIFASQVASVITSPVVQPVPDASFAVPS
tara:strand:- start:83 stop:400 length:318 start_codon:yes stop_codon:yes gene_type:complete